jgi:hypothetical protein
MRPKKGRTLSRPCFKTSAGMDKRICEAAGLFKIKLHCEHSRHQLGAIPQVLDAEILVEVVLVVIVTADWDSDRAHA